MMNFISKKTVGIPRAVPLTAESLIPTATQIEAAKGYSSYVIHKVNPSETLDRVSLIYNVPKDAIRRANGFTGDDIYWKKELIIPNACKYYALNSL